MLDAERTMAVIRDLTHSDSHIECPACGYQESISDPDVSSAIVSYWGDGDLHDFSCGSCGVDYKVKERVVRKFETALPQYAEDIA